MARLHELFWTFFKIGAFTIGGGYAMIPLMEQEIVDKRKWLDRDEFMDTMSLAQSMPGVFAVNMATNIGFRTRGYIGAITAILGNVLMPIVMIITIAMFFKQFSDNPKNTPFSPEISISTIASSYIFHSISISI